MDCVGKLEAFVTVDPKEEAYKSVESDSCSDIVEEVCDYGCPGRSHEDHTYCRPAETAPDSVQWNQSRDEVTPRDVEKSLKPPLYVKFYFLYFRVSTAYPHSCPVAVLSFRWRELHSLFTFNEGTVYVRNDRTWKFQKETVVATCGEDGQFFYHPDPFSPAPPFKGSPSAVKRMEYAAKRIDNRKYRGQREKVIASDQMDSATCSRCHMRFFLPFRHFKNRITYAVPENPYLLPMPRFRCPLCEQYSIIEL
ncbi:hypothetical protein NECAME_10060 [Necator americanus]|uniref:Uncharacterized protein n=1 Tax=Necator americanus TaxID=51031 RepID=W2TB17_NECAM|nr:hypothetical protein NECAME_10060 [Necator americanus]ETN79058.1 hypothetical protein NECAME_10060 [Necator americanus]